MLSRDIKTIPGWGAPHTTRGTSPPPGQWPPLHPTMWHCFRRKETLTLMSLDILLSLCFTFEEGSRRFSGSDTSLRSDLFCKRKQMYNLHLCSVKRRRRFDCVWPAVVSYPAQLSVSCRGQRSVRVGRTRCDLEVSFLIFFCRVLTCCRRVSLSSIRVCLNLHTHTHAHTHTHTYTHVL